MTHADGFAGFALHESLLKAVEELGYVRPTPIQEQGIPPILAGRDVVGVAQTGTGKTAAFVLPSLHRLLAGRRGRTRVLVMCPTRELAVQVEEDVRDLGKHTPLRSAAVYGGVGFQPQTRALKGGVDVVVATPGRLLDHVGRGHADFTALEVLILDEADRMLDMGFLPDIRRILRRLPARRQTLMFSATMPSEILSLAREILRDPVQVNANPKAPTPMAITHAVYPVNPSQKIALLLEILRRTAMPSVLVFTRTKRRADRVVHQIAHEGYRTAVLHGDRTQRERDHALGQFKQGQVQVLVATDIASRGLDIEDISHVVNFDVPEQPEDYIHRIGRTARVDAEGEAFTLVAPEEETLILRIEGILGRALPRVTLPDFPYQGPTLVVRGGRIVSRAPTPGFRREIWLKGLGKRHRGRH